MNKYITKSGQNLYDVALAIYGSIEGIFDLLISNPDISYETILSKGTELLYHEDFTLNKDIVTWLTDNKISVRNGNYNIKTTNIKTEIQNWIKETNSQNFTLIGSIDNLSDEWTCIAPPNLWFDEDDDLELASESKSSTGIISSSVSSLPTNNITIPSRWGNQQTESITVKNDWILGVKNDFNLDLGAIKYEDQLKYFDKWYSNGMIILPSDKDELEAYYSNVATPKIKIIQSGSSSAINMQIPTNKFIAIDWGDDAPIDFFHYQQETIKATHTYEDAGEHSILIYGHDEFVNLDFTGINGIYYALTDIYIQQQFITPYPEATTLNKLFIIKPHE